MIVFHQHNARARTRQDHPPSDNTDNRGDPFGERSPTMKTTRFDRPLSLSLADLEAYLPDFSGDAVN